MIEEHEELDVIFAALANRQRREILHRISIQPYTISALANELSLSLPAIHKHVKLLEQARLIQRKKSGRTNFLALKRGSLQQLRRWLDQYHSYWGSDNETLENYVANLELSDSDK